ncbi:DNase I-like protein [Cylindrobasidium torrendii FP15055 ss-10]|uniref:DNase I-like protein n=1 Tax=Cylindrobasidium torrendii FP15055 ss-10 TaxID=1314674 RepID=A0A0D7B9W3_9AGAR|nr:DNase I-like protein [Cylindrobasidium torrendii FP15055 ss-10]
MRIATYNLRYDSQPDAIPVDKSIAAIPDQLKEQPYYALSGEQPWSQRRLRVAEQLMSENIVIAGFQEALIRQVKDLQVLFGDEWAWVGVGRNDGKTASEFSPIFYKKSELKLLEWDTFWLSTTPFQPSKYPGAGSYRICTVAKFQLPDGKRQFTVMNTHLDDQSEEQRKYGVSLVLQRARYETVTSGWPVFLLGDLNSPAEGEDTGAYRIVTGADAPMKISEEFAAKYTVKGADNFHMLDLRGQTPPEKVSSNFATFTGFTKPGDASQWKRIDFIFGGNTLGWSSERYKVLSARSDDGMLASDHRPVFADISI